MNVGFVGLGAMGAPMAARLLGAGHAVTVWNRSQGKAQALAGQGATVARTPAEAAAAGIVVTMLTNDAALDAVTVGPDGILAGLPEGGIHVSCSTISIAAGARLAQSHRETGRHFLAATVLGRPPAAQSGMLFIMAAGDNAVLDCARPVLDPLGQRVFVLGDQPAHANLVKLCCNFLIFSTIEQMAEVFAITGKAGIDRELVFQVLTESFFSAPVHRNYGRLILDRAYDATGVDVALALKDTGLMLGAADALTAPMPLASLVRDKLLACAARGESKNDFAILAKEALRTAGLA
jgi:3-hydroxyisobutyrate dehydrogenase-like beta-hydroxyacid dehydrogenase